MLSVLTKLYLEPIGDEESEGESEESECPDYFSAINTEKKKSVVHVPPQNYIKPKKLSLLKNKGGSKSFLKSRPKPKADSKDDFNIELI